MPLVVSSPIFYHFSCSANLLPDLMLHLTWPIGLGTTGRTIDLRNQYNKTQNDTVEEIALSIYEELNLRLIWALGSSNSLPSCPYC